MIAGNLGGGDTTRAIGSLAVGVSIFNFIYWNCSFLRMGTSGLTSQAFGRADRADTTRTLLRSLVVASAIAVLLIALHRPLADVAFRLTGCTPAVERLARLCTTQQLDPVHLFDVIHDFLDQEAATV